MIVSRGVVFIKIRLKASILNRDLLLLDAPIPIVDDELLEEVVVAAGAEMHGLLPLGEGEAGVGVAGLELAAVSGLPHEGGMGVAGVAAVGELERGVDAEAGVGNGGGAGLGGGETP